MSKWKPAFALLLVFVAGMFVGVVGTRMAVRRIAVQMLTDPVFRRDRIQGQMELQLARRLHLRPEQRVRVREILAEMQGQLKLINEETQPRRQQVISNAAGRIDLVLGPEQKIEFEKLKEDNRMLMQPGPFMQQQPQPFRQQQPQQQQ
jgi:hypothetical protein